MPVVSCSTYWVIKSSGWLGVNVADPPPLDTVPTTGMEVLVGITCMVPVVTVSGSMILLKVTVTAALADTLVALAAGFTATTLAAVKSAPVPVVKLTVTGDESTFPLRSCTPAIVSVYAVLGERGTAGTRISL